MLKRIRMTLSWQRLIGRFGTFGAAVAIANRAGAYFGGGFGSSADAPGVYTFDFWLRVPIPCISALRGARVGATGSSFYDLLMSSLLS